MNLFNRYIIKSQLYVSLCLTLLCAFFQEINIWEIPVLYPISFLSTLVAYNLAIYSGKGQDYIRAVIVFFGLIFTGTLVLFFLSWKSILTLIVLGILCIFYSAPDISRGFRWIPLFKTFLIALIWAGTVIILPGIENNENIWKLKFQFLSVFFFVLGITIPFDIRDVKSDIKNLKTIPQVLGTFGAKILAIIFIFLSGYFFVTEFGFVIIEIVLPYFTTLFLAIIFIIFSFPKNHQLYFTFGVESLSLFPFIFLQLFF